MGRIAGVELQRDKKLQYALHYINGKGPRHAKKHPRDTGVQSARTIADLGLCEVCEDAGRVTGRCPSAA